ncbi:MAG TPA: RES family NAD+ phosphorylase [Allosphingosinicella sp.]|nr:RES family NAD+ phosphorylase [Allosphingosinicella sp.]
MLDLLGEIEGRRFDGTIWRVVRNGRSVIDGSRGSGRWNTAAMSVLYGATDPDGAIAEVHFHLSRGQPVFPSKMAHNLFELSVRTGQTLVLGDMQQLTRLGVDEGRYRELLYGRTQEIAAAAAFLGFDGLIAPSARWNCTCAVLFLNNFDLDQIEEKSVKPIHWKEWIARK